MKLRLLQEWLRQLIDHLPRAPSCDGWQPQASVDARRGRKATDRGRGGPRERRASRRPSARATRSSVGERWHYNLNPEIKKGRWTAEEDAPSLRCHTATGRGSPALPGRTDMAIKNRYHTLSKRAPAAPRGRRERAGGRTRGQAGRGARAYAAAAAAAAPPRTSPPRVARAAPRDRRRAPSSRRSATSPAVQNSTSGPRRPRMGDLHVTFPQSAYSNSFDFRTGRRCCTGRRRRTAGSCSPEPPRLGPAADLGTPEPPEHRRAASAASALSALSRARRAAYASWPCGGP